MEIKYNQNSESLKLKSINSNLKNQITLGDVILLKIKKIVIFYIKKQIKCLQNWYLE